MNNYVIFTDSACDIANSVLADWGVKCLNLTFRFEDSEEEYTGDQMQSKEFYDHMRSGRIARTAAVNIEAFKDAFAEELEKGNDVFYLGISEGLSTTYNSARVAAQELSEKYPDRKIVIVSTMAASAGQGLLVYFVAEKKKNGASIEETAEYINNLSPKLCHWFTVDDLVYLKRGGRISPAAAIVGNVLGIKPVLHVDDEGKLVNMAKSRGRKAALKALADKYDELAEDLTGSTVFVSHADCIDDVKILEDILNERHGIKFQHIADISPVIGAHAGPGTLAIFFVGKQK